MSRSTPEFEESRVADEKQPSILVTIPERLEPLGELASPIAGDPGDEHSP